MFALSFRNIIAKDSFLRYYILLVEIKDFNVLIDNRPFFDHPLKKQTRIVWKTYWDVKKWRLYTTGNLLNYLHNQNNYKLIGIE